MKLGIFGAGSIGCYVGGRLAARGADVVFVGRPRIRDEIAQAGLTLRDVAGAEQRVAAAQVTFDVDARRLAAVDVVLCAVKCGHTEAAARELATAMAPDAMVISLQNGLHNAALLRQGLPGRTVLGGIVSFNVVSLGSGVFQQGTSGPLIIERSDDARALSAFEWLERSGFEVETPAEIESHQWAKLTMNLGNAVSALSGAPTRDLILAPGYRRILTALLAEALDVMRDAGIRPARLRGVPVSWLVRAMSLPTPVVRLIARAQLRVNPDARSSMWEDVTRGRPTEIDQLNGEIVSLARSSGRDAPLNRRIVELVHQAEAAGRGSPGLTADALFAALQQAG